MGRRYVPFNDADYLDKLSPSERRWYKQFVAEHYFGRQPRDRSEAILPKEVQRQAWREQHAQRRDAQWRAYSEIDPTDLQTNPVDALIDILDAHKARKLPLSNGREALSRMVSIIRGILMAELDRKNDKELEYAIAMFQFAIDCVSAHSVQVSKADYGMRCLTFLQKLKSDLVTERQSQAARTV